MIDRTKFVMNILEDSEDTSIAEYLEHLAVKSQQNDIKLGEAIKSWLITKRTLEGFISESGSCRHDFLQLVLEEVMSEEIDWEKIGRYYNRLLQEYGRRFGRSLWRINNLNKKLTGRK